MKKNMKGITLVSLVITIIVMLILAGVSISMATGNNGVLTRGQQGALNTKLAAVQEDLNSAILSLETDYRSESVLESAMEAKKDQYFTVATKGTLPATKDYINNHKGLNDYLNRSKVIVGSAVKNAAADMQVNGAAANTTTLTTIAGLGSGKAITSAASSNTNCLHKVTALYLTSDADSGVVGGDLYVALYYVENSIPTFIDVGIVQSTSTKFANGCAGITTAQKAGFKEGSAKGKGSIVDSDGTAITGITWLNNAECENN